ncbi:hypothetical protein COLO4_06799 [Corchorus olitorius]|uniref:Uncharacterized protein n=1 Tax=Corchorus olitorius TaxID=93759 RepID=A0A1R3KLV9_9ROSI|nr:hypothetical protein COLO4_06799 [Corchorus olitorius]
MSAPLKTKIHAWTSLTFCTCKQKTRHTNHCPNNHETTKRRQQAPFDEEGETWALGSLKKRSSKKVGEGYKKKREKAERRGHRKKRSWGGIGTLGWINKEKKREKEVSARVWRCFTGGIHRRGVCLALGSLISKRSRAFVGRIKRKKAKADGLVEIGSDSGETGDG